MLRANFRHHPSALSHHLVVVTSWLVLTTFAATSVTTNATAGAWRYGSRAAATVHSFIVLTGCKGTQKSPNLRYTKFGDFFTFFLFFPEIP